MADGCWLAFDSDDPEFIRGVEVGMLIGQLPNYPGPFQCLVHDSNAEMILRAAEANGRSLVAQPHGDGGTWLHATFGAPGTGP